MHRVNFNNLFSALKAAVSMFIAFIFIFCFLARAGFAQDNYIDFNLDITGSTKATPSLLIKPGIDLSGRGLHGYLTWPQNLAAPTVLTQLKNEINLQGGIFRIQFDLWEFVDLAKNKYMQISLLDNYSTVIKDINAAGGIVILNLYGMPPGLGKVLDKKSSPWDIKAFKEFVKDIIHYLSCEKGYNIWYEVWNAPDLDDFFLGEKKEYFDIYQAVAQSIKELEKETNRNIPVGGPGVSWWFQNLEGNTVFHPERSLIYELIRFCSQRKLPLDFISWHAYTSDPFAESEITGYKKIVPELIREWLSYFDFASTTPLIISEWNYDAGLNFEPRRGWESNIAASFIPSRIKTMLQSGIDHQIFFCLEDFKNNKQGIDRNVGLFWFEPHHIQYAGGPKSMFNVFRMLNMLGSEMYLASQLKREFVGIIATKTKTGITLLLFNYVDPEIATSHLSRHLSELHPKLARSLVKLINSDTWEQILNKKIPVKSLRINRRVKAKIKEAIALNDTAQSKASQPQNINLKLSKLNRDYTYKKYIVDKTCCLDCAFLPREEKEITGTSVYEERLILEPYSVVLIAIDEKPVVTQAIERETQAIEKKQAIDKKQPLPGEPEKKTERQPSGEQVSESNE